MRQQQINYYIQWDDSWLLSVLRLEYFRLRETASQTNRDPDLLGVQLEEFLSNHKMYYSLIKRPDSFRSIDDNFLYQFSETPNWDALSQKLGLPVSDSSPSSQDSATWSPKIQSLFALLNILKDYVNIYCNVKSSRDNSNKQELTNAHERYGFFLVALAELLMVSGVGGRDRMPFVREAVDKWKEKWGLDDALFAIKRINPGLANTLLVTIEDEVVSIGAVSPIADELIRRAKLTAPFFVYTYQSDAASSSTLRERHADLGDCLFRAYNKWLQKVY